MNNQEIRKKILAAYDLLEVETTTSAKFESIRTLVEGINPRIDDILGKLSKARADLSKLEKGEIIELTAEHLPENSEKEKRKKKATLLFIKYWRELQGEVERIKAELAREGKADTQKLSNILASAKGPLGIITVAAVILVGVGIFINSQTKQDTKTPSPRDQIEQAPTTSNKIKVIEFQGKKIPLNELTTGIGLECQTDGKQAEHYHALNHTSLKATDGTTVTDPGGCGFGKVDEVRIEEISF